MSAKAKAKSNQMCHGKDAFERMNFLYQAATEMADKNPVLSSYYANMCKTIAKKSVLRLEPEVKRTICRRCSLVLKPGITADMAMDAEQNGKTKVCKIECTQCGHVKRFVMNKRYDLWLDNEKSVKQVIVLKTHEK